MSDSKREVYDQPFNFVVVGDAKVGRTSLLRRFVDGTYESFHEPSILNSPYFKKLEVADKTARLCLSDVPPDRRGSLSDYRGVNGMILVFDITNVESFLNIEKHLGDFRRLFGEDIECILVGAKSDLEKERQVPV